MQQGFGLDVCEGSLPSTLLGAGLVVVVDQAKKTVASSGQEGFQGGEADPPFIFFAATRAREAYLQRVWP